MFSGCIKSYEKQKIDRVIVDILHIAVTLKVVRIESIAHLNEVREIMPYRGKSKFKAL